MSVSVLFFINVGIWVGEFYDIKRSSTISVFLTKPVDLNVFAGTD